MSIPNLPASVVTASSPKFASVIVTASGDTTGVADAAALNAAIGAGAHVSLGPGTFHLNATWNINQSNVRVSGSGPATVIQMVAGAATGSNSIWNALRVNSSASNTPPRLSNIVLENFTLDVQGGTQTWAAGGLPGGLTVYAVDGIMIRGVVVKNGRAYNINLQACTQVQVIDCRCDTCYSAGGANTLSLQGSTSGAGNTSDVVVRGCEIAHTASVAIASVSRAGTTATFVTSTPHLISPGQYVKVTGVSVNDFNGYWNVGTVPSSTTFVVTLNTTPAGSGTGGSMVPIADKNIFCNSVAGTRTLIQGNVARGAFGAIVAEVGTPGTSDFAITDNVVDDFASIGVGVDNSSGVAAIYAQRGRVSNNVIRGRDGTGEFGMPGSGSNTGLDLTGNHLDASHNIITNVRQGISIGYPGAIEEDNLSAESNTIVLAADAQGVGIFVEKAAQSTPLRRLRLRGNTVDGQNATGSGYGIYLDGNVQDFVIDGNIVRGMGRSGFYLHTNGAYAPSYGSLVNNRAIDNNNAQLGTLQYQSGFAIEGGSTMLDVSDCWAYDTRSPSQLQTYGLVVLSGATKIRALRNHFEGNLTDEVSDGTNGGGLVVQDPRDPIGLGMAMTVVDPARLSSAASLGANNRIVYTRVIAGGGKCTGIYAQIGAVDTGTPTAPTGTRQVNTTGVWPGTGIVRAKVTAYNASGESVASAEATATLVATTDTILWAWTAPTGVTGIVGYRVYRSAIGGATGTEAGYIDTASTALSYVDTGSALTGAAAPPTTNATGSDQIAVAVYSPTGTGRSSLPGTRKAVSALTTAVAGLQGISFTGGAVRVSVGDWLAIGAEGRNTTIGQNVSAFGAFNVGLIAFQDGATGAPVPPATPSPAGNGTALAVALLAAT